MPYFLLTLSEINQTVVIFEALLLLREAKHKITVAIKHIT